VIIEQIQLYPNQFDVIWADTPVAAPAPLPKPALRHADAEGKEVPGWLVSFAFERDPPNTALIALGPVDLYRYHLGYDKGPVRWGWTAWRGNQTAVVVSRAPSNLFAFLDGDEGRIPVKWDELELHEAVTLELMLRRGIAQYLAFLKTGEYEAVYTSAVMP
jgi:hypothetical protein